MIKMVAYIKLLLLITIVLCGSSNGQFDTDPHSICYKTTGRFFPIKFMTETVSTTDAMDPCLVGPRGREGIYSDSVEVVPRAEVAEIVVNYTPVIYNDGLMYEFSVYDEGNNTKVALPLRKADGSLEYENFTLISVPEGCSTNKIVGPISTDGAGQILVCTGTVSTNLSLEVHSLTVTDKNLTASDTVSASYVCGQFTGYNLKNLMKGDQSFFALAQKESDNTLSLFTCGTTAGTSVVVQGIEHTVENHLMYDTTLKELYLVKQMKDNIFFGPFASRNPNLIAPFAAITLSDDKEPKVTTCSANTDCNVGSNDSTHYYPIADDGSLLIKGSAGAQVYTINKTAQALQVDAEGVKVASFALGTVPDLSNVVISIYRKTFSVFVSNETHVFPVYQADLVTSLEGDRSFRFSQETQLRSLTQDKTKLALYTEAKNIHNIISKFERYTLNAKCTTNVAKIGLKIESLVKNQVIEVSVKNGSNDVPCNQAVLISTKSSNILAVKMTTDTKLTFYDAEISGSIKQSQIAVTSTYKKCDIGFAASRLVAHPAEWNETSITSLLLYPNQTSLPSVYICKLETGQEDVKAEKKFMKGVVSGDAEDLIFSSSQNVPIVRYKTKCGAASIESGFVGLSIENDIVKRMLLGSMEEDINKFILEPMDNPHNISVDAETPILVSLTNKIVMDSPVVSISTFNSNGTILVAIGTNGPHGDFTNFEANVESKIAVIYDNSSIGVIEVMKNGKLHLMKLICATAPTTEFKVQVTKETVTTAAPGSSNSSSSSTKIAESAEAIPALLTAAITLLAASSMMH